MYKLSIILGSSVDLYLVIISVASLCAFTCVLIYYKNQPILYSQNNLIKEQSLYIDSLKHKITYLYNGLFELEELIENLLAQENDYQRYEVHLEHKNRIIRNTNI